MQHNLVQNNLVQNTEGLLTEVIEPQVGRLRFDEMSPIARLGLRLIWPFVVLSSVAVYGYSISTGSSMEAAILDEFWYLIAVILFLEVVLPCHEEWNIYDRQAWNDLLYNFMFPISQYAATVVVLYFLGFMQTQADSYYLSNIWPAHLPLYLQVLLSILVLDLSFYTTHRLHHEFKVLWRLHAVHHSSHQLHIINNGRVHPLEICIGYTGPLLLMYCLGIPLEVVGWFFAIQQAVGFMTHSNIAVNNGLLSFFINTPEQHRWHHSPRLEEGNSNYGTVIMLWDHVFGTFYGPRDKSSSPFIGTASYVPTGFLAQVLRPDLVGNQDKGKENAET